MSTAPPQAPGHPAADSPHGRTGARAAQILFAAERIMVEAGSLPVSMRQVGEAIGASRALVYAHHVNAGALAAAVLADHVATLDRAGLLRASATGTLHERIQNCGAMYLDLIANRGPALHLVLRDGDPGDRPRDAMRIIRRTVRALAASARAELSLTLRESLALLELTAVIPEEAGRLVHEGLLAPSDARAVVARLLTSSIESLRPNRSGPA